MEPNFPRAHVVILAYVQKGLTTKTRWLTSKDGSGRLKSRPGPGRCWPTSMAAPKTTVAGSKCAGEVATAESAASISARQVYFSAYVGMGDKDKAFAWLNQAVAEHSADPTASKVNPPLRSPARRSPISRTIATGRACSNN